MACISKRRGKWVVDYRIGMKRLNPSFGSRSQAEDFLRELKLRPIDNATGFKQFKSVSIEDAVKNYLETITPRKSLRTKEVDTVALGELAKHFANRFVDEINLENLELYQLRLLKNVKASSVNRKFNVIKHFFKKCTEWKYCRENPTIGLSKLKEQQVEKKPLTNEQLTMLISSLPSWASKVFYFIAKTGVRRGEACDLTWKMVDFDKKVLKIKSEKGGVVRFRSIPMTEELFGFMLTQWNEKTKIKGSSDLVFLGHQGYPIIKSRLSEVVTRVGKSIGIENSGLHIVRHTLLTDLSNQNQSGSTIQKLAGHSSLVTTQKYLHPNNDDLRRTLEAHESNKPLLKPVKLGG